MVHLALKGAQSIQVISDDTDVFVLLLHFFALEKLTCRIFMVGSSHGKSSVDITATTKNHSEFISELLAGHALSGCDTVACLFRIGKGTIIKVLKRGYNLRLLDDLHAQTAKKLLFLCSLLWITSNTKHVCSSI